MRAAARLGLVALLAAALVALTLTGAAAGSRGRATTVKVGDNFYSPNDLSIAKKTNVRFKWVGQEKHNVVLKKGPGADFASRTTKKKGVNFEHKFKHRGTYNLICTVHTEMKLTVDVG